MGRLRDTRRSWTGKELSGAMLIDLGRRFVRLFVELSEEGNAPDTPDEAETETLDAEGERRQYLTSFGYMRELLPTLRLMTPAQPGIAMTPNEVAAWDMLYEHAFSRASLRQSGELGAYETLGISLELERRWRAAYVLDLLADYANDPRDMDVVLLLAAEYRDEAMLTRAVDALDEAVDDRSVPDAALLAGIHTAMQLLAGTLFAPEFEAAIRARLLELADCTAYHLNEYDPGGEWRATLEAIRGAGTECGS